MYRLAVLLVVVTWAGTSVAQPMRPGMMSPQSSAGAENQAGLTADGKIMLGLDGRGNYRKPRVARKAPPAEVASANRQTANNSAIKQVRQTPPRTTTPPAQRPASVSSNLPLSPSDVQAIPPSDAQPPSPSDAQAIPVAATQPPVQAPQTSAAPAKKAPVMPNALPALQPNGGLFTDNMR